MEQLGVIIFDLDGTLLDSMGLHADAFSRALVELAGAPAELARATYVETAGHPLEDQFADALRRAGGGPGDVVDALAARFRALVDDVIPPLFPDVEPHLRGLAAAGYTLVISSGSSPEVVRRRLAAHGVAGCFRLMLGTDKGQPLMVKGDGHFTLVRRELGLDPADLAAGAVMVGDAVHDMHVGRAAGLLTVGRLTGANAAALRLAGADLTIGALDELAALLAQGEGGAFLPVAAVRARLQARELLQ